MTSQASRLHVAALLLLAFAVAGCPAKTGGAPFTPSDLSVAADLAGTRFDLGVPDMAPSGDLAADLRLADLTVPGLDGAQRSDGNTPADLPGSADAIVLGDGGGQQLVDAGGLDAQVTADAGAADALIPVDGGATDQARMDGAAVTDLVVQPDLACVPLASFTNAQGYAGGNNVGLQANVAVNVAAGQTVTITAWTTPAGANPSLHAIYATDAQFLSQKDLVFTFDAKPPGNPPPNGTDQWFVVLPAQPAGTHVWVYLRADSCDKKSLFLPGNANYEYLSK